ncbi:MAG: hypothetical protein HOI39_05680 [Flavobacteriales bacterium]|nr:hypothetical protein [Flavobacteriales bacterium]
MFFIILFFSSFSIIAQNSTIRFFPIYSMFTPVLTNEGLGVSSVAAIGTTLGYDHKISDSESIEFNLKPRIHIFDGDQDASEFRSNVNYKKFIKYNFYTSSGLGFNFIQSFSSWSPYGGGDYATILTVGPNLSFGRRTMFSKRFFLDFGLGFAFNYPVYHQIKKRRPIDLEANDVQFSTFTESGPKIYYFNHVLAFQFGYILK